VNNITDLKKIIAESSQNNKIDILISLRAFLADQEDYPWVYFKNIEEIPDAFSYLHSKNILHFKNINTINLRKAKISPVQIYIMPKNKRLVLIDLIDYELSDEIIGPPISIIHDLIFPGFKKKEAFVKAFRNFYDNTYYTYSTPYYKSIEIFSDLITFNCDLNIVSNKPTTILNKLLVLNNIDKYFNHVSGYSEINISKKDRLKSLVELETQVCENIVIGDTIEDFEMAKYTNCKFIFAEYGYGTINTEAIYLDKLDSLIKLIQKI
jgi:phosphoglycolate phosphatase-like HAD superfamily hydrolase